MIEVPRLSRICLGVRLIMPWRLPDWVYTTLPVPVTLKRFLALEFVFSLGIWLSFGLVALLSLAAPASRSTRAKRTATAALDRPGGSCEGRAFRGKGRRAQEPKRADRRTGTG